MQKIDVMIFMVIDIRPNIYDPNYFLDVDLILLLVFFIIIVNKDY